MTILNSLEWARQTAVEKGQEKLNEILDNCPSPQRKLEEWCK